MWAIESSEYCVRTFTGHPHTMRSFKSSAFISMVCAVNSFRKCAERGVREALSVVTDAIRRQLVVSCFPWNWNVWPFGLA